MRRVHSFIFGLLALSAFSPIQAQESELAQGAMWKDDFYQGIQWREVGPWRGGRSVAVTGFADDPLKYLMGSTGGGVWQTDDAGQHWTNISDGFFKTGSVGAIAVAPSHPKRLYVGMGEHAVRGVMTSPGDGMYRSLDGGKTWEHIGLPNSRHISAIRVHPQDPDLVFVAVQGAVHGPTEDRGIYRSTDGGRSWEKVLYIDDTTGASDLSMDPTNPNILYAGMWSHRRLPWKVVSGGEGSGIFKSTDGGDSWQRLTDGLPTEMGKVAVSVSPANPERVYANIEAKKGGVYRSDDGGQSWKRTSADRITIARAWYYIEIFADPQDQDVVYVLNAPMLKSVDGGKTFKSIQTPHGDQHDLWINPDHPQYMINANDGGATVSLNGGKTWSRQDNQPTAQFYRVITDHQVPYRIYGGQQDNTSMSIVSQNQGSGIGPQDWRAVAGGESAFLAFDPDYPRYVYGGSYQGNISVWDQETGMSKDIMAHPEVGLGTTPNEQQYRFNWNAPIVSGKIDKKVLYHAAQMVLQTRDGGHTWQEISPDLTRNDSEKQAEGGGPFTNEAAGGENYNTISYLVASPHEAQRLYVGTDDGLVHTTRDGGTNWSEITPNGLDEALINHIAVSPHDSSTVYVSATKYKFDDFSPIIYKSTDFGKTWLQISTGIHPEAFVRAVQEDPERRGFLYAATERGLYVSTNQGRRWNAFQLNLPIVPITDLVIQDNDLIVATAGRGFWILDDLSPWQQSGQTAAGDAKLYRPKATYRLPRLTGGGPAPYGQNPKEGVGISYWLPQDTAGMTLKLEVFDGDKQLIRTYTPEKNPDNDSDPVLSVHPGINRFYWDMRTASLPKISKVLVLGDFRGHVVAPGRYSIRLTVNGKPHNSSVQILPDPRLDAMADDYEAQAELLTDLDEMVHEIHASVNQMRNLQQQIQKLLSSIPQDEETAELHEKGESIVAQITEWELALIQPKQQTFQDVINFPNQLSAEIMNLKTRVDSHDPLPTIGAQIRANELREAWFVLKGEKEKIIRTEVKSFNAAYRRADIQLIRLDESDESQTARR
ncbi:VPS10 domain-containing protein [Pontibacter sp. G13]|uniref:WD40/YVTN/BNR-like repeat-containing protein n=1 Tax=Pontibacter sp. G13 TaxID=3074898 RepID=UPI00288C2268|nr:glycosyl hydrolase [Pontibacter sp. G13]WNJ21132.1 glycosyl hydrolase [Pontibacter sp. G13]